MLESLYRGSETCNVCKCCNHYLLSSETKLKYPNKDLLGRKMEIVLAFVESDSASRSFVLRNYIITTVVMLLQNRRNVINCSVTEISVTSSISSPYNPDFFTSCTALPLCRNISLIEPGDLWPKYCILSTPTKRRRFCNEKNLALATASFSQPVQSSNMVGQAVYLPSHKLQLINHPLGCNDCLFNLFGLPLQSLFLLFQIPLFSLHPSFCFFHFNCS